MESHKRDNAQHAASSAALESQMREGKEKREKLKQEKERETAELQDEVKKLSKELSDSKVSEK